MKTFIEFDGKKYEADLSQPFDLSIPLRSGDRNPNAFGIQPPLFQPYASGDFIASVAAGASVNCENLFLNPHGNGTHTECAGHITRERITINETLTSFFFVAQVISVSLTGKGSERYVSSADVITKLSRGIEALVIRTLPNDPAKLNAMYSGNNPGFVEAALCRTLNTLGVKHLLVDLPSVDPEKDNGALAAHKAFWNVPDAPRLNATISEMIFVKENVEDGLYLLNLQIAAIESDASPSKPVLYAMHPTT